MKNRILFISVLSILISCKESENSSSNELETKVFEVKDENIEPNYSEINNPDTLIYQDEKLISKSEFRMYGNGVANLFISDEVIIYNQDESVFGKIFFSEESESYVIDLPKLIKARYFVPILDQFYFDAVRPDINDSFLKIYVNSEIKKIKKANLNFKFIEWDNYIKHNFIKLRKINSKQKYDSNTYKVIKLENDSALIKSITKSDCDLIETSKDISKKIKWKEANLLLISFFECN